MLMEELFRRGIMRMGYAADDPSRLTGLFNLEYIGTLPSLRREQMQRMLWLEGEWTAVNKVPATGMNPAYEDRQVYRYRACENGVWICLVTRGGELRPHITYDAFSGQFMYVLSEGAFGVLRSPGWDGNSIVFTGEMTMIGVNCVLRQTWTKESDDAFAFVNEERLADGRWGLVDEWEFRRRF